MSSEPVTEHVFSSTPSEWKYVKVNRRPQGTTQQRRSRYGFRRLDLYPRRRKVRITISYRGGAESWWLVEGRGTVEVFPGHMLLEDFMARIYSES